MILIHLSFMIVRPIFLVDFTLFGSRGAYTNYSTLGHSILTHLILAPVMLYIISLTFAQKQPLFTLSMAAFLFPIGLHVLRNNNNALNSSKGQERPQNRD
jgi:hypothetical protein